MPPAPPQPPVFGQSYGGGYQRGGYKGGHSNHYQSGGDYQNRKGGQGGPGGMSKPKSFGDRGGHGGNFGSGPASTGSGRGKFKTTKCKNFDEGSCRYGSNCTYAHGDQELRRYHSDSHNAHSSSHASPGGYTQSLQPTYSAPATSSVPV